MLLSSFFQLLYNFFFRRLYSWLLGLEVKRNLQRSDSTESMGSNYFSTYSKPILVKGFTATLKYSLLSTPVDMRPYRILISLLDKVEIGPVILEDVLFNVIRTMYLSKGNSETTKQANLLFSNFESSFLWDFMTSLYGKTCIAASNSSPNLNEVLENGGEVVVAVDSGPPNLKEICKLTEFLLEIVSLEMYNETTRIYLPRVLLAITKMLTIYFENLLDDEVSASLHLLQKIVIRVQPMMISPIKPVVASKPAVKEKDAKVQKEEKQTSNTLEKSKSDSRLNQLEEETLLKKSQSVVHGVAKALRSPKKTKKSKSYSKLNELDKEIVCTDTGQLKSSASSTPNLDENESGPNEENTGHSEPEYGEEVDGDHPQLSMPEYSILEKCIKQYEIFYQVYVSSKVFRVEKRCGVSVRVLSAQDSIEKSKFLNEDLVKSENPNRIDGINAIFATLELNFECRISKLKDLLNACLSISEQQADSANNSGEDKTRRRSSQEKQLDRYQLISRLVGTRVSDPLRDALKIASSLLVDMSTFPNYNQDLVYDEMEQEPPPWLKVLSIIACYLFCDKEAQISVISILFELISLLRPLQHRQKHSSTPGVTAVIMLPLMQRGHLNYLRNRTRIFHVLVSTLWDYLGNSQLDNALIARLLYQLHNSLGNSVVEQVIGNRIENSHLAWSTPLLEEIHDLPHGSEKLIKYTQNRLTELVMCKPVIPETVSEQGQLTEPQGDGFRKFELLWTLAPNTQESECGFELTQLKMFDVLNLPLQSPIRSIVVKWLQDSLIHGDIGNLLKPLLKILLSLQTRRVGLLQVVATYETVETDGQGLDKKIDDEYDVLNEKDLFAVSAEASGSGVKYRTEAISGKKKSPKGLRIFGVPLMPKSKSPTVPERRSPSAFKGSNIITDDPNISLIVNPLEITDLDAPDPEDYEPLSSSAPSQRDGYLVGSQSTGELSRKKMDLSDSGSLSAESIESGPAPYSSLPPMDSPSTTTNSSCDVKRYSGHCEQVDEKLRAVDKVKNRKTYKLTKDEAVNDDGDNKSLTEMSAKIRQVDVNNHIEQLDDLINNEGNDNESLSKDETETFTPTDIQKRLSYSSKQSIESSSSSAYSGSNVRASSVEPPNSLPVELLERLEDTGEESSLTEELANLSPAAKLIRMKSKTPEATRRTSRGKLSTKMNWEKTKEKFEKSKLNLEILRQNLLEENMKLDKVKYFIINIVLYHITFFFISLI